MPRRRKIRVRKRPRNPFDCVGGIIDSGNQIAVKRSSMSIPSGRLCRIVNVSCRVELTKGQSSLVQLMIFDPSNDSLDFVKNTGPILVGPLGATLSLSYPQDKSTVNDSTKDRILFTVQNTKQSLIDVSTIRFVAKCSYIVGPEEFNSPSGSLCLESEAIPSPTSSFGTLQYSE